jgi:hypothetical protein
MDIWTPLSPSLLPVLAQLLPPSDFCDLTVGNLWLWREHLSVCLSEAEDFTCLRLRLMDGREAFYPLTPTDPAPTARLLGVCETEGIPLRRVGLIRVTERAFPREVIVGDAQYVYRPLGTVPPSSDSTLPYFYNTLPHGTYVGISKTADGRQFNAAYARKEAEDPFSMYGLLPGG